jgi:hypothetical protein
MMMVYGTAGMWAGIGVVLVSTITLVAAHRASGGQKQKGWPVKVVGVTIGDTSISGDASW